MAENRVPQSSHQHLESQNDEAEASNPLGKSPSKRKQLKHVDFTALKKTKAPMAPRKSNIPHTQEGDDVINKAGDRNSKEVSSQTRDEVAEQMETQRMQLISPPPEEELNLRRVSIGRGVQAPSNGESSMTVSRPTPAKATTQTKRKRAPASPIKYSTSASSGDDLMNGVGAGLQRQQVSNATPNPKPRKQRHVRTPSVESPTRGSFDLISPLVGRFNGKDEEVADAASTTPTKPKKKVVVKSPHARNLEADYIPPLVLNNDAMQEGEPANPARRVLLSRGSRRSATPIPAYEPPTDVFTPPREIFVSPAPLKSVSKSSKRKTMGLGSTKNANRKGLKVNTTAPNVAIKQEIPDDIDLRAPMPPASPTDDPLLLSGPDVIVVVDDDEEQVDVASTPTREHRRSISIHTQTQDEHMHSPTKEEATPQETDQPLIDDFLPPSSPEPAWDSEDAAAVDAFEWGHQADQFSGNQTTDNSMMQLDDPKDAEVEPLQLFDFIDSGGGGGWSDSDDDEHLQNVGDREEGEGEFTGKWTMTKIRTKEDPPSSATRTRQDRWGRPVSPFPNMKPLDFLREDDDDVEEDEVRRMSIEPEALLDGQEEEEERQVHEMSMELEEEINLPNVEIEADHFEADVVEEEDGTDSEDDLSVVKIVSADPRAAARAVAILKQHDYDCFTKVTKRRRASYSTTDELAKHSRTRDVVDSGILKSSKKHRRSTMGVVGGMVVIPGTPIMTLPELLLQAENEVFHDGVNISPSGAFTKRERDPFKTPVTSRSGTTISTLSTTPKQYPPGEREWAKDDWKLLDACFTDLRLELGEPEEGLLAEVERIELDDVVFRFEELLGGRALVDTFGELWSNVNLLERSRALRSKQLSGHIAPPTTPFSTLPFRPRLVGSHTTSESDKCLWSGLAVPDFTPLSRPVPHLHRPSRPVLPPPTPGGLFDNMPSEGGEPPKRLPSSLLAPRYSHLLDEANAVSQDLHKSLQESTYNTQPCADFSGSLSGRSDESVTEVMDPAASSTMGTRVKSFFTSYLPLLPRAQPVDRPRITQPGLPLPPKDVLEKPRGPVTTPARLPAPRVPHPKDLVQLTHAPLPPSNIPRPRLAPKRLVELNHVPLPEASEREASSAHALPPRPRRSSASSVRDLVQGFEKIGQVANTNNAHFMKRTESLSNLKVAWKQAHADTRPMWKP